MATETEETKSNGTAIEKVQSSSKVRDQFILLGKELVKAFPERQHQVRGLLVATLAGEHLFLIGPPGTGKSLICRAFASAFTDSKFFDYLLTRYTEPNELFGPIDLQAWNQKGVYERRVAGYLPTAHFAFLDEIFKANSAILNSLLTAVNERMFFDDGRAKPIPLETVVCASNEQPSETELEALFDRFLMRYPVHYVKDPKSFRHIVRSTVDGTTMPKMPTMTLAGLAEARREVAQIGVPDSTIDSLFQLRADLENEGITVSDRRWARLMKITRAYAYFCGDTEVDPLHFEILVPGLWREEEEWQKVQSIVAKVSAPQLADAVAVYDAIMEQVNGLPATGDIHETGGAVAADIKHAKDRLKELGRAANAEGVRRRIRSMIKELTKSHNQIIDRVRDYYGMNDTDEEEIPF